MSALCILVLGLSVLVAAGLGAIVMQWCIYQGSPWGVLTRAKRHRRGELMARAAVYIRAGYTADNAFTLANRAMQAEARELTSDLP